jgi:hypothetical protein
MLAEYAKPMNHALLHGVGQSKGCMITYFVSKELKMKNCCPAEAGCRNIYIEGRHRYPFRDPPPLKDRPDEDADWLLYETDDDEPLEWDESDGSGSDDDSSSSIAEPEDEDLRFVEQYQSGLPLSLLDLVAEWEAVLRVRTRN